MRPRLTISPLLCLASLALGGCFNYDYLSRNFDGSYADGAADMGLSPYAQLVMASSPLAYYRLDEVNGTVAIDASGNGHDGTVGSSVKHVSGLFDGSGGAASFPGGEWTLASIIGVPRSATLEPTSSVTVEAWVHANSGAALSPGLVSYGNDNSPSSEAYLLGLTGGMPTFNVSTGLSATGSSLAATTTVYLAGVYDGVMESLYVNGELAAATPMTGSIGGYDGTHGLALGSTVTSGAANDVRTVFPGVIDEVAIYGAALSATTIKAHYQAGGGQ